MKVGECYRLIAPMSGRRVVWEIESIGHYEVKVSGVWLRLSQVTKWINQGAWVITERASAQESNNAEHQ